MTSWTGEWTEKRIEMLKHLWGVGVSASQIAAQLGGVTRSAVIGKVHRLGLAGRARKPKIEEHHRPPRPKRTHRLIVLGNAALAFEHEPMPKPEPELIGNVIPIGQRRTLLELTDDTCHWPIGDPATPDFYFCGGVADTGLPYCKYHCSVAYQPPQSRRRPTKGVIT